MAYTNEKLALEQALPGQEMRKIGRYTTTKELWEHIVAMITEAKLT